MLFAPFGGPNSGDNDLAECGWSHGASVPVAFAQVLAEFSFEAVHLLDERGYVDAEGDCCLAEGGVAAGLCEAVQPLPRVWAGYCRSGARVLPQRLLGCSCGSRG